MFLKATLEWHLWRERNLVSLFELSRRVPYQLKSQLIFNHQSIGNSRSLCRKDVFGHTINDSTADTDFLKSPKDHIARI